MLVDYDPNCRAMQDYRLAFEQVLELAKEGVKGVEAPAQA